MPDSTAAQDYNYAVFEGQGDFDAFMGPPHVGEKALDGALSDLEGARVALSDLWRERHLILEFGSYT